MSRKSITIPMAPKALEKIQQASSDGVLNIEDYNRLAGWDADAKFAQARARMRLEAGVPVRHSFVWREGVVAHLYEEVRR